LSDFVNVLKESGINFYGYKARVPWQIAGNLQGIEYPNRKENKETTKVISLFLQGVRDSVPKRARKPWGVLPIQGARSLANCRQFAGDRISEPKTKQGDHKSDLLVLARRKGF
jgi:hypothetical protein